MRFSVLLSTLLLPVVSAGFVHAQKSEVIDGVAAVVNKEVITISQVRELIGSRERSLREVYSGNQLAAKIAEGSCGSPAHHPGVPQNAGKGGQHPGLRR